MLWTIIVILVVLWLLGFLGHVGGSLIHLLLVVAVVVLINRGRQPARLPNQNAKLEPWLPSQLRWLPFYELASFVRVVILCA